MRKRITDLAIEALIIEVELTPKPGLVDKLCNGSHSDMTIETFYKSAEALRIPFENYLTFGESFRGTPVELLDAIRSIGIDAEHRMFQATEGINTHKGANFMFGILLAAIGYAKFPSFEILINTVKDMCKGLVSKELDHVDRAQSNGEMIYKSYKLTGIRGEVEKGFPLVTNCALPLLIENGLDDISLKKVLLTLIKENDDTNMVKRGGISGLEYGKSLASLPYTNIDEHLEFINQEFINHNLSPGGSADLLAVSYFLYQYIKFNT